MRNVVAACLLPFMPYGNGIECMISCSQAQRHDSEIGVGKLLPFSSSNFMFLVVSAKMMILRVPKRFGRISFVPYIIAQRYCFVLVSRAAVRIVSHYEVVEIDSLC